MSSIFGHNVMHFNVVILPATEKRIGLVFGKMHLLETGKLHIPMFQKT